MLQSSGCSLPKQVCTLNPAFLKPLYLWGFVSENMCVCTHLHECKAGGIFVCVGVSAVLHVSCVIITEPEQFLYLIILTDKKASL